MDELRLSARGLKRVFPGGAGVHGVDLDVEAGQVHALVGLNGAGKTTLMRLVLGGRPRTGILHAHPRRRRKARNVNHPFRTALVVEAHKLRASRVVLAASVLLLVGISVLVGAMTAAAEAGNEQILSQLGPLADQHGWERFWGVSAQVTSAAGLLCFGVVLAWIVGREFADGTITGLFAITIPKATIALAKLSVMLAWSAAAAVGLAACLVVTGTLVVGAPDEHSPAGLGRLLVLTVLSGLLATPTAWAATLGRGLLPGVAIAITMIATAQVFAVAGTGAWFPVAAPALWAIDPDSVSPLQLALVALVPIGSTLLTIRAWSRLQLDR